jgi:signal transduction histidine kinase
MAVKNIEKFFLNTLLKISMVGVFLIFLADLILYPEDRVSLSIDLAIFSACLVAYLIRQKHPTLAIFIITTVVLAAMLFQCLVVPVNTTTSLSIILIVGFIFSVMLNGRVMWAMHALTFLMIHFIFLIQFMNPERRFSPSMNDLITVSITYSILYFILTYATAVLKSAYDKIYLSLRASHIELHRRSKEIANQNEMLMVTQENLNALNTQLEAIISERTAKIQAQNEALLKYSYANAHHLRGPIARLLGLASIYRLDSAMNTSFIMSKMEEQANEIDAIVRQINIELEQGNSNGKQS